MKYSCEFSKGCIQPLQSYDTGTGTLSLGKSKGYANPQGSQVWVSPGPGPGHNSPTRELSNKPKNIFFEAKLKELQLILQNSSKFGVSPSFLGRFGCFWTCFDG